MRGGKRAPPGARGGAPLGRTVWGFFLVFACWLAFMGYMYHAIRPEDWSHDRDQPGHNVRRFIMPEEQLPPFKHGVGALPAVTGFPRPPPSAVAGPAPPQAPGGGVQAADREPRGGVEAAGAAGKDGLQAAPQAPQPAPHAPGGQTAAVSAPEPTPAPATPAPTTTTTPPPPPAQQQTPPPAQQQPPHPALSTAHAAPHAAADDESVRYIVFVPPSGQGAGNILNGLLAAQLLGLEFNRTVCIAPQYADFFKAFDYADPDVAARCARVAKGPESGPSATQMTMINYIGVVDECSAVAALGAGSRSRVVWLNANTYPRWPKVPPNLFHAHYKPTPALRAALPWPGGAPPENVVHLRQPDGPSDHRNGLDEVTFRMLGEALPNNTFLVTNSAPWYDYFASNYNWSHPPWRSVTHTATGRKWAERGGAGDAGVHNTLQMLSDWYTLACAARVWHTWSDFSFSAVHWNGARAKTIAGVEEGLLVLREEFWLESGEKPRLTDRAPHEMLNCKPPPPPAHAPPNGAPVLADPDTRRLRAGRGAPPPGRYIVYLPIAGQGLGNVLNGLLAAHLVGLEFNRTVCVSRKFQEFPAAFQYVDPDVAERCRRVLVGGEYERDMVHVDMVNFQGKVDECHVTQIFNSTLYRVLWLKANTYPRWPKVPPNLLLTHYRPTPALRAALPWPGGVPPRHVVHLRKPDGTGDRRNGLDPETFRMLGEALPPDTFLVTNSVPWYDYFANNFNWTHPSWRAVVHSAGARGKSWGAAPGGREAVAARVPNSLAMFSDWLTIASAETVWHTFSDFSFSACHWQGVKCKTIAGVEDGALLLRDPTWIMNGENPRLSDRPRADMLNCKS